MARKHITQLIDDIDGTTLDVGEGRQINFSIDGRAYEIDLSDKNADKFLSALAPFVEASRQVSSAGNRRSRGATRSRSSSDLTKVREWARANGHEVNDRGRVPSTVLEAYAEAQV